MLRVRKTLTGCCGEDSYSAYLYTWLFMASPVLCKASLSAHNPPRFTAPVCKTGQEVKSHTEN